MNLSGLAIKRPVTVLMAVMMVMMLGLISYAGLTIDLYPELNLPVVLVLTGYEGAGPVEVENLVTRPLEEALSTVNDLDSLSSTSSPGSSTLVVLFKWGTDMDFAGLEIREQVDLIKGFLPDEADDPIIFQIDPNMFPVIQVGVTADMDQVALKNLAEDVMKNRIERLSGVAVCDVTGGLTREIAVNTDPFKLSGYGVSLDQISQVLQAENFNFSGGELVEGGQEYLVRTTGEFRNIGEIGSLVIGSSPTGPIFLRDLAEIIDGYKEPSVLNRMDGEATITLSVRKQTGTNTVQVVEQVRRELERMERDLPGEIRFQTAFDQSVFIEDSINNIIQTAIIGGLLAMLVLYLFLGNIRSTIIIGFAMPISIVATFVLMFFQGLTINIITMSGLALGIGMMIDNAIVILENIFRYRNMGENRVTAARAGSAEVSGAIIAATLTTMIVFLPVIFVEGVASILFSDLSWTVAFSLFASLMVALTIIPVLSSKYLAITPEEQCKNVSRRAFLKVQIFLDNLKNHYGRVLVWSLSHRKLVVFLFVMMLFSSLLLIPLVGFEFMPGADTGEIQINASMPVGTPLEETNRVASQLEEIVNNEVPEVKTVFTNVGSGGMFSMGGGSSETAYLSVMLVPYQERERDTEEIIEELRRSVQSIPGAEITVGITDPSGGGFGSEDPISIAVKGDDLDTLDQLSTEIAERVSQVEGAREIETSFSERRPELQIRLDRERAAALGVTTNQVASAVRMALEGRVATRYRLEGDEIDVRLQTKDPRGVSIASLEQLILTTAAGNSILLGQVADILHELGPVSIQREGQVRTAYVTGSISGRDLGRVMQDIQNDLRGYPLPTGYFLEYGGEQEDMMESFEALGMALIIAIFLVYMIMAAQFESLLYPFVIMFTLPQTFIGVVLALAITGRTLNVSSLMGVIMLSGIVVNNGIVLIDYINLLRREKGLEREQAIIEGGKTRLRPVLMTTSTTILGMLPLALEIGDGAEMWAPMATVMIGGLTVSTLLTLIVVPLIYTMLDNFGERLNRFFTRRRPRPAAPEDCEMS